MALDIETGSGVSGAVSFATVAELIAYASQRGIDLPADDAQKERLLLDAADYMESLAPRYVGRRYTRDQGLSWPRVGAYDADGFGYAYDEIPDKVKRAQLVLAVEAMTTTLLPTIEAGAQAVIAESIPGAVSVTYAQPGDDTGATPHIGRALALLRGVLRSTRQVAVVRA